MDNWNIIIQGVGPHHTGKEGDADTLAKLFAAALRSNGHKIRVASFTHAGSDLLLTQVDKIPQPPRPEVVEAAAVVAEVITP